ncbi:hypothetical protein K1W54_12480 [Micromonospora sp. CPCC 205371]|nr:hypothetical protein [Micromonospora sp. CPCC 205371]
MSDRVPGAGGAPELFLGGGQVAQRLQGLACLVRQAGLGRPAECGPGRALLSTGSADELFGPVERGQRLPCLAVG